jgi:hypothetical protein
MAKQKFTHFIPRDKPKKRGPGQHKKSMSNVKKILIAIWVKVGNDGVCLYELLFYRCFDYSFCIVSFFYTTRVHT